MFLYICRNNAKILTKAIFLDLPIIILLKESLVLKMLVNWEINKDLVSLIKIVQQEDKIY